MAAPVLPRSFSLPPRPGGHSGSGAPHLRLIQGGRSEAALHRRRVYRRRRIAVAVTLFVVAALIALGAAWAGSAPAANSGAGPAATTVHRVRSGETMWDIAREVAPGADVRAAVAELAAINGRTDVRAGDDLVIPSGLGR